MVEYERVKGWKTDQALQNLLKSSVVDLGSCDTHSVRQLRVRGRSERMSERTATHLVMREVEIGHVLALSDESCKRGAVLP
jgi:hypothetical protein